MEVTKKFETNKSFAWEVPDINTFIGQQREVYNLAIANESPTFKDDPDNQFNHKLHEVLSLLHLNSDLKRVRYRCALKDRIEILTACSIHSFQLTRFLG